MNLLATITLTQDYKEKADIYPSTFSDFTQWGPNGSETINAVDQSGIIWTSDGSTFGAIVSQSVTPITSLVYGNLFRVTVNIQWGGPTSSTLITQISLRSAGIAIAYSNTLTPPGGGPVTALVFDIDTTGLTFDSIAFQATIDDTSTPFNVNLGNLVISNANRPNAFNSGDRVLIYWDTDFVVQLESNPGASLSTISTGPNLGNFSPSQVTGVIFGNGLLASFGFSIYKYCDSLDLVKFPFTTLSPQFPYIAKSISVNDASCSLDPITCDVHFTSTPNITPCSNNFSSDGSVTLVAVSSHGTVLYSVYPPSDPRGQYDNLDNITGIMAGLTPGTYIFYAVDQYNCFSAITVIIPVDTSNVYGVKYRLQYSDVMTHAQTVADIEERGYTGDIIYAQGTGDPVLLEKNNGELNNKFDVIRPTFAEMNLNSEKHFQYIGLYSQDDRKYKKSFTHSSRSWKGFIVPSVYSEPYSPSKNYPNNLKFSDNLGILSQQDFLDESGNQILTSQSLLSIIVLILKKTGLNLNILQGINKYAALHDKGAADDPLDQTFIICSCFYDDSGTPMKCDEVLSAILKPFGAYIIQNDSVWNIVETDSQCTTYNYRIFDYKGAYQSNGTSNHIIKIDRPYVTLQNVLFADSDHVLEMIPAYGKITITHDLKSARSIFPSSLDAWQVNSSVAGFSAPYPTDTNDKGVQLFDFDLGSVTVISPLITVTVFNDALSISLKYLIELTRPATFTDPLSGQVFTAMNVPNPLWLRIQWTLLMRYSGVDFYFNENIGWTRIDIVTVSVSSVVIPTSHPTSKSLTIGTGLTLPVNSIIKIYNDSTHYFRAIVTSYNSGTGALVCSSYANVGTGTFSSWSIYVSGPEFQSNFIYASDFGTDFSSLDKTIDLPAFTTPTDVVFQMQISFEGPYYKDFTDSTTLNFISSSVYPEGTKFRGTDLSNAFYLRWYNLRSGDDAESSPTIIRTDDFNSLSNAVVLDSTDNEKYKFVQSIRSVKLEQVFIKALPNKAQPPEKETITLINDPIFKENLDYELMAGDLPAGVFTHQQFTNIFRYSDGSPTSGWGRTGLSESDYLQNLLMGSLINQYKKPTWRLSGSFLALDISFVNIVKHTVNAQNFTITNPNGPNGTGWEQAGAGQPWTGTGPCNVSFDGTHTGNSTYVRQAEELIPGSRIRVNFTLARSGTSGTRIDRFVCIIFNGSSVVQKVTLVDGLQYNTLIERNVLFNLDAVGDKIGFFIENISGIGSCSYEVGTFDGHGVASVRYYMANALSRSDRFNSYRAEFLQLLPINSSSDINIDDTGGGGTDGTTSTGGGNTGAFSGGYSDGFS